MCSIIFGWNKANSKWCTWSRRYVCTITRSPHHHRRRPNALWDVICSVECVCVYVSLSGLLYTCGVRCHIHERMQLNISMGRRTDEQNERTYQNKRFKCTFPFKFVCVCVHLTQTKFQTENISMRGTFLVCRHSLFNVSFRGYCLFICLFAC